jgi:hypothetical protein
MADVYYNEFDPFAAAWLRSLILDGQVPAGNAIVPQIAAEFIRAAM